jgi:WD40 repeat protein
MVDRYGDPLPPGAVTRLGTVRHRLGDDWWLMRLAFLSDNKTLVAAHQSQPIQFWDARTGKRLRTFDPKVESLHGFAVSANGKYCAAVEMKEDGSTDPAIRIWEIATGKEVRSFTRKTGDLQACAFSFSTDGKLLFSIGNNATLRVENVESGAELMRHQFPAPFNDSLAVSSDGSTLLVSVSEKFFVWRWQTGEQPGEFKARRGGSYHRCLSPDGKRVADFGNVKSMIRVWDVGSARVVHELELPAPSFYVSSMSFSPDGKLLLASGQSNRKSGILIFDAATGQRAKTLDIERNGARNLTFSPDSRLLAAASWSGQLQVWDCATWKEIAVTTEAHSSPPSRLAAAAGDRVVTAGDDCTIRIWDPKTGKQLLKLSHDNWVRGMAVSPDGTKAVSSSLDDTVALWDLTNGQQIYKLPGHGKLGGYRTVAFTANGKFFLSFGDDYYLRKWDVKTGKAVIEHRLEPGGRKPSGEEAGPWAKGEMISGEGVFTPDGRTFVLNLGTKFHVFDVANGKQRDPISYRQGINLGSHIAISPDGKYLLASSWGEYIPKIVAGRQIGNIEPKSHHVHMWELSSGKPVHELELPDGAAGPVAFSSDGTLFAEGGGRPHGHIRLYDTATGREVRVLEGFQTSVRSLAFLPDGKRLLSGMTDTTALVWDLTRER